LHALAQKAPPIPTPAQLYWHKQERIMFIHFAPNTWTGLSQDDNSLPLNRINPSQLDTDQWCRTAKLWGARMIVFVAKHSGGFCWWQTNTSEYSVKNIPWRNGKGDLLADISKSCTKYDLDLGVYIYPGDKTWGAGLGSGGKTKDPAKQEAYNKVFRQQITEVLTRYKPMKEVWFDGSCVIDISDILKKYAKDAVIFQGPSATIRWVGNERGVAPYPNWYTLSSSDLKTGTSHALHSDPNGDAYAPVEVDVPFLMSPKHYKWFWAPKSDSLLMSVPELMDVYYKSVGRGSVLLLNATPDTTGLIPESHVKRYEEFGKELMRRFGKPLKSVSGVGKELAVNFGKPVKFNHAVIEEGIEKGQRIRKFVLEGLAAGEWKVIQSGSSVGTKRITQFPTVSYQSVRLRVTESNGQPVIRRFSLYNVEGVANSRTHSGENIPVSVGGWDRQTFGDQWTDLTLDLTPQFVDKVGQFELRFQYISHDRDFREYGLEFADWTVDMYGGNQPDAIKKTGRDTFMINYSQHTTQATTAPVIFKTRVRSRQGRSVGNIELKMVDFK
jgi:alpha-L-fucosidase